MTRHATIDTLTIAEIREKQRRSFYALVAVRPPMAFLLELINEGSPPKGEPEYGRRLQQLHELFDANLKGLGGLLVRLAWAHVHATFSDRVFSRILDDGEKGFFLRGGKHMDCQFCNVRAAERFGIPTSFGQQAGLCDPCYRKYGLAGNSPPEETSRRKFAGPNREEKHLPSQTSFPFFNETGGPFETAHS